MEYFELIKSTPTGDERDDITKTVAASTNIEALKDYCLKEFGMKTSKPEHFTWDSWYYIYKSNMVIVPPKESTYTITKIEQGDNGRERYIYALLVDETGDNRISATLDYILQAVVTRGHKVTNMKEAVDRLVNHYENYINETK